VFFVGCKRHDFDPDSNLQLKNLFTQLADMNVKTQHKEEASPNLRKFYLISKTSET